MIKIAVLITCHNRRDKTLLSLENLALCHLPSGYCYDTYLVDDGSSDGTAQAVAEKFPLVNIINGNGFLFWNRGMHLAWLTAKSNNNYQFYLWLNDDTVLMNNAIQELLDCAKLSNGDAIICGSTQSNSSGTYTYGGRDIKGRELVPNGRLQTCHTINGNCVLVNKNICDNIGILDDIFPHAIGDFDYGLRAIKQGFKLVTTRTYVGYCERNAKLPKWCYNDVSLAERWKSLYSPLGNSHPKYFFIFEKRHYGLLLAVKHYITIHLRVLIPSLWK